MAVPLFKQKKKTAMANLFILQISFVAMGLCGGQMGAASPQKDDRVGLIRMT